MSDTSFAQRILDMLDAVMAINIPSRGRGYAIEDITLEAIIAQLGLPTARLFLTDGLRTPTERFPESIEQMRSMAQTHTLGAEPKEILLDHPGTYLVKHPFGKNNWPEFVLHHDGRFLPIEIKSSGSGQIVWNGGLPRQNCLYIYNYTSAKSRARANGESSGSDARVTVCFGSDLISRPVYDILRTNHEKVQAFAQKLHSETFGEGKPFPDDFGFNEYARAMFNHKRRIHGCPETDMWAARSRQRLATWAGADEEMVSTLRIETQLQEHLYEEKKVEREREAAERDAKRAGGKTKTAVGLQKDQDAILLGTTPISSAGNDASTAANQENSLVPGRRHGVR